MEIDIPVDENEIVDYNGTNWQFFITFSLDIIDLCNILYTIKI